MAQNVERYRSHVALSDYIALFCAALSFLFWPLVLASIAFVMSAVRLRATRNVVNLIAISLAVLQFIFLLWLALT